MVDAILIAQFLASGAPATGLTVAVDVYRIAIADGTASQVVTAGAATETGSGLYHYRLASADMTTYVYAASFETAGTADQTAVPALAIAVPDALVSTRLATAGYTAPDNASVTAIKAKTDNLPSDPADQSAVEAAITAAADALPTAAEIWANATRTLTSTAAATAAAVTGSALAITRAATYAATLTGLSIGAWTKIYLTIKRSAADGDDSAILQLVASNPAAGSTDGVLRVNKAAATVGQRTLGALTVNQGAGTVAIALQDDLTELLPLKPDAVYDLKALYADGSSVVLTRSTASIAAAVTGAIG